MNSFSKSFLLGLICTLFLFVMSVIITLGVKTLYLIYAEHLKKDNQRHIKKPNPKPKTKSSKTPKPAKKAKIIGSIEIDPEQIDKFYVKKSS